METLKNATERLGTKVPRCYFIVDLVTAFGGVMIAVKGIYNGGDMVKIDTSPLSFIHEPYDVVVAFLHPAKTNQDYDAEAIECVPDKRKAGFQVFMNYKGRLPAGFDYLKELADYRDERYGRTN